MYDRAPRSLTLPSDSTGHSVGPGSYEPPEFGPTKYGLYHISFIMDQYCLFAIMLFTVSLYSGPRILGYRNTAHLEQKICLLNALLI